MAFSNIYKNRKLYIPYFIAATLTIMMNFMISSLRYSSSVNGMKHGEDVVIFLKIALVVTLIFSVVLLFYTNSFLIKRRNKELGLYNILGMEKRHIAKMMFYESVITAVTTTVLGIVLGIVFGKFMFLLLMRMIQMDSIPSFQIPLKAFEYCVGVFIVVYVATFAYNLACVHLTKPIELLHGGEIGEKEPKTKMIMAILGLICVGGGYYFAQTVTNVMSAINYFFIAVIFVVIGTYLLFMAGSIALIKALRKNKRFYYQTRHFMSVSGMLYRMKQNAVGLANICILSTMVLITVATTVCLYAGMQDSLDSSYPKEVNFVASIDEMSHMQEVEDEVNRIAKEYNAEIIEQNKYPYKTYYGIQEMKNDTFTFSINQPYPANVMSDANVAMVVYMSLADYNNVAGMKETLNDRQILIATDNKLTQKTYQMNTIDGTTSFDIQKVVPLIHLQDISSMKALTNIYMVIVKELNVENFSYNLSFNTNLPKEQSIQMSNKLSDVKSEHYYAYCQNRYEMADEFGQMYGGLLFIGVFIGTLFLMATVLIIYYKQISEGYEDRARFEIMMKVGMSKEEVKQTIRSQIRIVFFLPLLVAALHVIVSYRLIKMLILLLSIGNGGLFIHCTIATVIVFSIIYALVFLVTARSYYQIVNEK